MSQRNDPLESTSRETESGGSTGRPSTSTRCNPTRKPGLRRARATASSAAGPLTIKLAAVRMPVRCAVSTASFTSTAAPKSSAVTIRRCTQRPSGQCRGRRHWVILTTGCTEPSRVTR
jgi:hypothetical protein